MHGADEGFSKVWGHGKVRGQRQVSMGNIDVDVWSFVFEFAVTVGCKQEGFNDGCPGNFKEKHFQLLVNFEVYAFDLSL